MRRERRRGHVNHERWLVSYADFITLLFAFFVVMYSASQVDKRKVGKLARSVQIAFDNFGIFQASNPKPAILPDPLPFDHIQTFERQVRSTDLGLPIRHVTPLPGGTSYRVDMAKLKTELAVALQTQIERNEVVIGENREGIVISLREVGFFESGSSEIKLRSEPAVAQIAEILKSHRNYIRIEGHTDNMPIHNRQFSSNWQLSTARATQMVELFISRYGLAPSRLSAGGYAEFHPVASNSTPEGKTQNRRVDLVVPNSVEN